MFNLLRATGFVTGDGDLPIPSPAGVTTFSGPSGPGLNTASSGSAMSVAHSSMMA